MLKATYTLSNLFSLKRYQDGHLNCRSFHYITAYAVRSAILGTIIQLDGKAKAKELFPYVKNALLFVQAPDETVGNMNKIKRTTNRFYTNGVARGEYAMTIGVREYVDMDKVTIYMDNTIPNLELYLKNIDHWGESDGVCSLTELTKADALENVLVPWDKESDVEIYEQYDWAKKMTFEDVYMFSDNVIRKQERTLNMINPVIHLNNNSNHVEKVTV